jgi:large subunit ribosomal protein L17
MLASLVTALLRHKRITTTVAKAKETRRLVEKLITRARNAVTAHPVGTSAGQAAIARKTGDATAVSESQRNQQFVAKGAHARRQVGRLVKDRAVVGELFSAIAEKVGSRPGGYTRVVKLGQRQGDGAEMAVIELVDFNTGKEVKEKPAPAAKEKKTKAPKKTRKTAEKGTAAATKEKQAPEKSR